MRMSRRFAQGYCDVVNGGGWSGHWEFVLPTVAHHLGLVLEDIGGDGRWCPPERRGRFYTSDPADHMLRRSSFRWRPPYPAYFHEAELAPATAEPGRLVHPVKPLETTLRGWRREVRLPPPS